ncbi:MAG: MFS transporter [Limosilactobacillus coleohominis]|uniref:MFS transporter n=1 Tax=Limosilactobacillus coleohominis TaxID=181675 RepID=UPI002A8416A1|nr:MFS transporter [Limosilactobacillus coleohominis]MCI5812973.1 MFS transporter [Lactobacillus sp.]MDY3702736.1 MFS transporter [Limosilactobacillus coleohominis]MDY5628978.1 MFS transporter [Limosilactobacillus coleohominis]
MRNKNSMVTKLAFLSVSFMLTSAYAVQSALPQLKASLNVTQTQSEYLATTPSFAVMIFVVLSPLLQQWFKISDKKMIMIGVTVVGLMGLVPFFNIHSYPIILGSRLLLGAGYGLYNSQAISMISVWYEGETRAQMLGWRAAAEQIGQACTLFLAGLLLTVSGWHASFLVYALAFVVLLFFGMRVPDDSEVESVEEKVVAENEEMVDDLDSKDIKKISPVVYLLVLFAFLLVVDYVGMENRFSGLAVNIRGAQYTGASNFLSLMLIGATLGGLLYGSIQKRLGFGTVYLGLGLMALSNFLFYFAGSNFAMLVIGLLLIGFPLQLVSPLIFNLLPDLAPANRQPLVTSMVLIGFNFGAFFSPTIAEWTNHLMGRPTSGYGLAAPFLVYGIGLLVIALIIFVATRRQANK